MNPSIQALEETLASIEGAEMAWSFCSGMAAETSLFLTHGREGIVCIGDAYGGTLELLESQIPQLGIKTHLILGSEIDRLDALRASGARLVFFETPTNPTLELIDIRAVVTTARKHGALVAVDNTFASPVNQHPLDLGADFVVHSATKYLGGHSDLTAGCFWLKRFADANLVMAKKFGIDDSARDRYPVKSQSAHFGYKSETTKR